MNNLDKNSELMKNILRIHTTGLGEKRVQRNLSLDPNTDVIELCRDMIRSNKSSAKRNGKNWYLSADGRIMVINAYSYTIITAYKEKK